jgi:hypothetical protein
MRHRSTRFGRKLDKLGYIRFRHWRLYGERGLVGKNAAIWLYAETLLLEFSDEPLAQYSVAYESDQRRQRLRTVTPRQLFNTKYSSLQQALWELGDADWLQVVRVPPALKRQRYQADAEQLTMAL